jgi:hypothetical protein
VEGIGWKSGGILSAGIPEVNTMKETRYLSEYEKMKQENAG